MKLFATVSQDIRKCICSSFCHEYSHVQLRKYWSWCLTATPMLSIYALKRTMLHRGDWRRLPPRAYNSLIYVLCLHFISSAHNAEAARSLSARSSFLACLCASRFSRVRSGTLKADNRMRSINHFIHLISAIVYTTPFARSRDALTGDARAIIRPQSDATE